jgi:hypothetical protein
MLERRDAYRFWLGEPDGKLPFGKSRRIWDDNIKMDLN